MEIGRQCLCCDKSISSEDTRITERERKASMIYLEDISEHN